MYHLSLLQTKILSLSAYPPIHSFIQFGSGILHWLLSLNHCIWSIACLLIPNPSCFLVPPDLSCCQHSVIETIISLWKYFLDGFDLCGLCPLLFTEEGGNNLMSLLCKVFPKKQGKQGLFPPHSLFHLTSSTSSQRFIPKGLSWVWYLCVSVSTS